MSSFGFFRTISKNHIPKQLFILIAIVDTEIINNFEPLKNIFYYL